MVDFPHKELTYEIIGASMEVHNQLKPGLDEKLYERALIIELTNRGLTVNSQKRFPVEYKGRPIGTLIPDLIVEDKVIVDPKVVTEFHAVHISQMLGYLNITDLEVALLVNFKNASLEHQRVFKKYPH